jgi:ribosomal protein S18 acetylase RimI-like enzyme
VSPEVRRFLWREHAVVGFFVNVVINGAIVWATFRGAAAIPRWGQSSVAGDLLATSFLLPAITCLIVTPLVRGAVRRGAAPAFAGALPGWLGAFRRALLPRALLLGLVCLPLAGGLAVALLHGLGVEALALGPFIGWKALYAGVLGAGVQPAIALLALADAPAQPHAPPPLAPAGPADLERLLPLVARFTATQGYPFDAAGSRAALAELLARPELGRVYAIVSGEETIGYAVLCFGWSIEWGGRDAFLDELYLEPAWRGRGLARAALRALLSEARAAGVRAVHLEVEAGNEVGQALYRSEGFEGKDRAMLSRPLR